ncbi:cysteine hydrolase [Rubripirellula amarantea]|nr:cysteine hydrolase [Rubripirellula amarantea]
MIPIQFKSQVSFILTMAWLFCATSVNASGEAPSSKIEVIERLRSVSTDDTESQVLETPETWDARHTAVIVCDMWDLHHCYRAVQRVEQMLPRMESLLTNLRDRGATIIHAPSDCVGYYTDHPAFLRTSNIPTVVSPADIQSWCYKIDSESKVKYPVDQTDGGEDDTVEEHEAWAQKLKSKGLDPKKPWTKQHDGLSIDADRDYISDKGDVVWAILKKHEIDHVILVGVHTNMCVLGRPFGLRQLKKNGVDVVLMRDLTDAMYNPRSWPFVSHAEGTRRVIEYIEQTVCPTISSEQILGGAPFAFSPESHPSDLSRSNDPSHSSDAGITAGSNSP